MLLFLLGFMGRMLLSCRFVFVVVIACEERFGVESLCGEVTSDVFVCDVIICHLFSNQA
jgi:hypothetical protein